MYESNRSTLLIGNGLNNCLNNGISWANLLEEIAKDYLVNYNGLIPMPLEFESILNQILAKEKMPSPNLYDQVKQKVASKINNTILPYNAIHHELYKKRIDAIMTTNYDNLLEYVFNPFYEFKGDKKKTYLFDETSQQQKISFYHIHGLADNPKTICLGYEHYMGVVENLRRKINTEEKGITGTMKICQVLFDPTKRKNTWYERFYTDDISIVGLGLSESEVDLWWLITHRAYLYFSNYGGVKKYLTNKITYYDIIDPKAKNMDEKEKKHFMLKNSHVNVEKLSIGKDCSDYEEGYRMILDKLGTSNNYST